MQLRLFILLVVFLAGFQQSYAQTSADVTIPITVTTTTNPVSITLTWTNPSGLTNIQVARKTITQTSWTLLSQPGVAATTYTDNTAQKGVGYEYLILQQATGSTPSQRVGLVYAGVEIGAVVGSRGKILLVIDSTLSAPLSTELARYEADLRGDGWRPVRLTIIPAQHTVSSVKALLKTTWEADPTNTTAAMLIGDIPVPYSGNINPDGHPEHQGAWPTDYYYGDMDEEEWTDAAINNPNAARAQNKNVPGDGKFDQSITPTLPELIVSRVDFSNLSGWSVSQTELYRRYLNKNHNFRIAAYKPQQKTLVDDNFGYFNGEAFAQNGWRNGYALTGVSNTVAGDFFNDTDNQSYLVGYGCGAGSYNGAAGVGTSDNFKTDSINVVFSMLFGSYHGDWDYESNPFMPSALASKGSILTCTWAGRPNWFLHHMALGQPISTSAYWVWLNSFLTSPVYPPNFGADLVHVGLLGDLTLRAHALAPPTNLTAKAACGGTGIDLSWTASPDAALGYMVYRSNTLNGAYTLITANPINTTTYNDIGAIPGKNYYLVKAIKLESVPTGSYFNQSTGAGISVTYIGPGTPITTTVTPSNPSCFGLANGSVALSASGGNGNYTYLWNTSATTSGLTGVAAGSYTVTVTDASGCTTSTSTSVTQPAALQSSTSATNVDCFGQNTGSVSTTVTGGTSPYTYLWNTAATTVSVSNLPAGNYIVTITDVRGCSQTSTSVVSQPASAVSADGAVAQLRCNGQPEGSIDLAISGGTAPYQFDWADLTGTSDPEDRSDLPAGTYSVTVTDNKGCTSGFEATLGQPDAIVLSAETTNASCAGIANGTATLTVAGGTAGYAFLWSNASTAQNLTDVPAGIYGVTVTDINSCSSSTSVTINQNTTLAISLTHQDADCAGSASGSAFINISGGQPGYTILWSNDVTIPQNTNLAAGTYTVTVTDEAGCQAFEQVDIEEPTPLSAQASFQVTDPCSNPARGNATVSVSGGTGSYSFLWNNGTMSNQLLNVPAQVYAVKVTDSNGCTIEVSSTEPQLPPDLSIDVTPQNVTCFGASNGSVVVAIEGGTSPYTYDWAHLNGPNNPSDLSGLPTGTFTVTVTDEFGCTISKSIVISQPTALQINATSTTTACGLAAGTVTATASGGTPDYTWLWNTAQTTSILTDVPAGTYTVTATDANGCTATISRVVEQTGGPEIALQSINAGCNGASNGQLSATVNGGTSPYTYLWSNQATTANAENLTPGTYTVTVSDVNGCTNTSTGAVEASPGMVITEIIDPVKCNGEATGSILLTIESGTAPYDVMWSNNTSGPSLSGVIAGVYSVTITDAVGCTSTATYEIGQNPPLQAIALPTDVVCPGTATGSIEVTVNGGATPYSFKWSDGSTAQNRSNLAPGFYSATITDFAGCVALVAAVITDKPPLVFSIIGVDTSCEGEIHTYEVIATPNAYIWTVSSNGTIISGQGTSAVSIEWVNAGPGVVSVVIEDAAGCEYSSSKAVDVDGCVGTQSPDWVAGIQVFPNPFSDQVNIVLNKLPDNQVKVQLTDAQGRVVEQTSLLTGNTVVLDLPHLPSGVYNLSVIARSEIYHTRIIKQ